MSDRALNEPEINRVPIRYPHSQTRTNMYGEECRDMPKRSKCKLFNFKCLFFFGTTAALLPLGLVAMVMPTSTGGKQGAGTAREDQSDDSRKVEVASSDNRLDTGARAAIFSPHVTRNQISVRPG